MRYEKQLFLMINIHVGIICLTVLPHVSVDQLFRSLRVLAPTIRLPQ